jgi:hypothetical protein
MTFSIMTFAIITFSIMTFGIITFYHYVECHYDECHVLFLVILNGNMECRYADCHILTVIMLPVIMPSVIMLNVEAPKKSFLTMGPDVNLNRKWYQGCWIPAECNAIRWNKGGCWRRAETPPASTPPRVTRSGSPPKATMLSRIHSRAEIKQFFK